MLKLLMIFLTLNCFAADFKTGSEKPTKQLLEKVEQSLDKATKEGVVLILVEAHADARGTRESNMLLTERRAETVKQLLESKGVKAKIVTVGKGEASLLSKKHSDNRRVELTSFDVSALCSSAPEKQAEVKRNRNILSGYLVNSRQGLESNVQGLNGEVRSEFGNGIGVMYQREVLENLWIGGGVDTNKGKSLSVGVGF